MRSVRGISLRSHSPGYMSAAKVLARKYLGNHFYGQGTKTYNWLKKLPGLVDPLPDFLIIGTQKGGTTSLYNYLTTHPRIYPARTKEILFFDYKFTKGQTWYRSHFSFFSKLKTVTLTGEASPDYLYHPHAARRIATLLPNVKLIVLLRNPVDRAISYYWWEVKGRHESLPMHAAFHTEDERIHSGRQKVMKNRHYYSFAHEHFSYLDRGKYAEQLERYFCYFERENMLILRSEDFFSDTQKEFDKVLQFLGLPAYRLAKPKPKNTGTYRRKTDPELKQYLAEYFQPYNQKLYELLHFDFDW